MKCKRCKVREADPITKLCEECNKELHPKMKERVERELRVHKAISEMARK